MTVVKNITIITIIIMVAAFMMIIVMIVATMVTASFPPRIQYWSLKPGSYDYRTIKMSDFTMRVAFHNILVYLPKCASFGC